MTTDRLVNRTILGLEAKLLLSMTGHGRAQVQTEQLHVDVEIRTVNNRFLKTTVNCDLGAPFLARLESLLKRHIARGSVNLKVRHRWLGRKPSYSLDLVAIRAYRDQLSEFSDGPVDLNAILGLPGVVLEAADDDEELETVWPAIEEAVMSAIGQLNQMRVDEGATTAADLTQNCREIGEQLEAIRELAPAVAAGYATKMTDRINQLLTPHEVTVAPSDIIREVGIFAERVDISEETVRLGSHLAQFREFLEADNSNGRKLDFLTQEMLRETNTIGSKANDAQIANHVVEIKTRIERIREQVQNIE